LVFHTMERRIERAEKEFLLAFRHSDT